MKREIKGIEGFYASDNGNIYDSKNKKLKKYINTNGYHYVIINDFKYSVDYIIAKTFIQNEKFILVRHRDNNKLNDCASNLEWYYAGQYEEGLKNSSFNKPIVEYDSDGNITNEFDSLLECMEETKFSYNRLRCYLNGLSKESRNGKYYRFKDEPFEIPKDITNKEIIKPLPKKRKRKFNKKVYQFDLKGNFVRGYKNVKECVTMNGLRPETVYAVIKRINSYFGYYYSYNKNFKLEKIINRPRKVIMYDKVTKEPIKEFKSVNYAIKQLSIPSLYIFKKIVKGEKEFDYILKLKED